MLVMAGLPPPNAGRGAYVDLFQNPARRQVAMQILVQAATAFDKKCPDVIGVKMAPEVKKELERAGNIDF